MYQVGFNQNSIAIQAPRSNAVTCSVIPQMPQKKIGNTYAQSPSFKGEVQPQHNIRTEFANQEEIQKYSDLVKNLDPQGRRELDSLLKNGRLLNNDSNDKSTALDNLHKMLSTPRASGLTPQMILKETVSAIANPFVINQKFGNIPDAYLKEIPQRATPNPKTPGDAITKESISIKDSNSCVSASIEFTLAMKNPAEFTRFAEGLTSPKVSVDKTIDLKNLTDNTLDSVWLLNAFEVPYEMKDFNKAKLTLAPDKNAIIRAQIQNNDKDAGERSLIDVLMQSTFMNVASQQTYDSLTDIRGGKFNDDNRGLIEFEKTFTESIVHNKNKTSFTYQELDENQRLTGYTTDFKTMEKQLLDSLKAGENVIIGYVEFDKNKKVVGGHEITLIGAAHDKNGDLLLICNDTDDGNPNPIVYPAKELLPKIHHAGLPQEIAAKDVKVEESWREGLKSLNDPKEQA